jgi:hypothetical protein
VPKLLTSGLRRLLSISGVARDRTMSAILQMCLATSKMLDYRFGIFTYHQPFRSYATSGRRPCFTAKIDFCRCMRSRDVGHFPVMSSDLENAYLAFFIYLLRFRSYCNYQLQWLLSISGAAVGRATSVISALRWATTKICVAFEIFHS